MSKEIHNIMFMTVIAGRKHKEELLAALSGEGARLTTLMYGKGTVNASYLQNSFGLVPEEHKVVISCLLPQEKCADVFAMLGEKFDFAKPNTGIAFTIPVSKISF